MPPKARVVTKKIGQQNEELSQMFNQIIGVGDNVNIGICYPKYKAIHKYLCNVTEAISLLTQSSVIKSLKEFQSECDELQAYCNRAHIELRIKFKFDLQNPENVNEEEMKKFSVVYNDCKNTYLIQDYLAVCNRLIVHKKFIGNEKDLSYKFILNMAGLDFIPFKFSNLNFKRIFTLIYSITDAQRRKCMADYVLLILHKIYVNSHELYKVLSEPDIDVEKFAEAVLASLSEVRRHIPNCGDAFKKLEESVSLLKSNFGAYYQDFVSTQNQTIIMENFVLDVSKNTKASPTVLRQFREIINFYKKNAQSKINDPRAQKLFNTINEKFAFLNEHDNLRTPADDDLSDSSYDAEETDEEDYINYDTGAEPTKSANNNVQ